MTPPSAGDTLSASPEARPALLEGHWLDFDERHAISAINPASVIEGDGRVLREFPDWLARHAALCPGGAAIGYMSYELAGEFEEVPIHAGGNIPILSFAYYPRIERLPMLDTSLPCPDRWAPSRITQDFDREHFVADVGRIRHYIAAGDIYQANLTQRFAAQLDGLAPEDVYARLASARAPMRAFLRSPHAAIVSNSPERFFRVRGNRILASPIKGTLARSSDAAEDRRRRRRLLASAKDRAENVMIVDLLRNDLGRICRYDSIDARLWQLDQLPHLFHLVSHVEGELKPQAGASEIIRALFPCGSITGAPKIRAMEILAEIERAPRGVSMGAIGIILGAPGSPEFEMDFSVAIRTMTIREGIAEFNVGCGIVYDSEPEAEYDEMLLKARPLVEALGLKPADAGNVNDRPMEAKSKFESPAVAAMSSSSLAHSRRFRR
ncbi:MAG: anthranilate synthase component I family protein [Acidobacteria bacterium]|nr:anthranilate synthase component I family protein [Acidobacteriota bacterium]